ncbi:prepilin-type N-terminal cleavage/methylation domain-containing protein [Alphaproteobacteria bacterium]|nr:prepilin-type N-terminal cleavage/methylation domain-containing protein [Alphaproteobacteria bacterium]
MTTLTQISGARGEATHKRCSHLKNEKGFTLVELAIVMIIIGLLIGGILKGQELIANAQIAATVGQIKGIDAAMSTFRDSYQSAPGDMLRAQNRLPNCTDEGFCFNGTGDSLLGEAGGVIEPNTDEAGAEPSDDAAGEAAGFWKHLAAADLLNGINGTDVQAWGEAFPSANVGGGFVVGQSGSGAIDNATSATNARGGMYLVLRTTVDTAATEDVGEGAIGAAAASRIDRKMDDGAPNGGTIRAIGPVDDDEDGCSDTDDQVGVYQESADAQNCSLAIRVQQ